ncbi:ornithine carbamoyltransferase [Borrelia miyamotoi]|uniref:Ornithine carbamoyltransferase n=1 Tax=Borrelia miyamotoi TaxID=47466 RepID=A0AAX3JL92_9SPIR|nr:ornithine carbamoyltransferase [Borrelia miyamotoi]QFP41544.1 ornithine carbamoyltransferase [Borrelia miyamotoi]QFP47666.1 ornithine carbamoyltransferase [Borrelia miyamotoi]QGT55426.1 ornithine carbamoyltransferase [Borrelia miyamotoi]QGT56208.1 ornithine carbamoyltransferase [Borrelia miyamotoi]WAZ71449.1 ornithine carbamoyltransferase [Borrelia miyamotoi]
MCDLRNRDFLRLLDFTQKDIRYLLDLSHKLKKSKHLGVEEQRLKGKNIAMIFEKDSTRTRCAFEVAAYDQGANVTYLGPTGTQIGKKESIIDTARVLERIYDAIEFRGFSQKVVEDLARYSNVPVYNGLTDIAHPTQVLADFMTIEEHKGFLSNLKLVFCGDGRNNVANSLMEGCSIMGMDFRIFAPRELFPDPELVAKARLIADESGGSIVISSSLEETVRDADVIYTDVWVSMGETNWNEKIKLLMPYQVNSKLMKLAKEDAIFMHCLPAFHDLSTLLGKEIFDKYGLDSIEVTDDVFENARSVVFDEAENRLHTIKAIMVGTLG